VCGEDQNQWGKQRPPPSCWGRWVLSLSFSAEMEPSARLSCILFICICLLLAQQVCVCAALAGGCGEGVQSGCVWRKLLAITTLPHTPGERVERHLLITYKITIVNQLQTVHLFSIIIKAIIVFSVPLRTLSPRLFSCRDQGK